MLNQAEKWIQRFISLQKKGIINIYNFNDTDIQTKYRYKKFLEYNEEWLDFVLACRGSSKEYQNYDIIEGGIANVKVFNTIELYFSGLIDKTTALQRLKFEKPNNQIAKKANVDEEKAMELFYKSNTYMLMSKGISDFHCLSDAYLVEEIMLEQK